MSTNDHPKSCECDTCYDNRALEEWDKAYERYADDLALETILEEE